MTLQFIIKSDTRPYYLIKKMMPITREWLQIGYHTLTTWYCAPLFSFFSRVSVFLNMFQVTDFPLPVWPTIITEWREFFVSYNWMILVVVMSVIWRLANWSSLAIAVFIYKLKKKTEKHLQLKCLVASHNILWYTATPTNCFGTGKSTMICMKQSNGFLQYYSPAQAHQPQGRDRRWYHWTKGDQML